jgi:Undecaprenyl-phosphate glucose phosphotransferase
VVKRSSQPLTIWFLIWDIVLTIGAWIGAYWLRFDTGIPLVNNHQPHFELCIANMPLVLILAVVSYRYAGLYEVHRLRRFREEVLAVLKGVTLLALLVMASNFARQYPYESRLAMVAFAIITCLGILVFRRLSWFILGRLRAKGYNQSHALIVGTGRLARRTSRSLQESYWMGIQTVAFVDDHPEAGFHADRPVLGPLSDLPRLVQELHIEHVFIALPLNRYAEARRVFDILSQTIVDVRLVADVPALAALSLTTSTLQGMTFLGLRESPYHGLNVVVKRFMDVVLSIFAIAISSPIMLAIALLIKLTSRGPVLYRQERCSLNGVSFMMLKFRTMKVDSEANGPQMTAQNDPRRTWYGGLLRATNLDELPQLFNVLRGDMSLVGPRPERPIFVNQFKKTIPNYMARHAVKCGMTGWAQVNGWRGNSSLRRRIQYDLYYITHWNPVFDLRILFLTIWAMLYKQRHAY